MTDMTLREYIRRRRLSLAAVELQKGNRKVTDIAMKYGYESPTAFTRAFKNFHGTTPSALKTEPVSFQAYPPLSFSMAVHGGAPLQFRVEEKGAFRIIGLSCPLSKELTENFERIPAVWDAALKGRYTCPVKFHGRWGVKRPAGCQCPSYRRLEIYDCRPFRAKSRGI